MFFFENYGAYFARLEKYKVRKYPRLSRKQTSDETKQNKDTFYQQSRFKHEQTNSENQYLISKWYNRPMESIKFMYMDDFWAMLERILRENDKQKINGGNK